MFPASADGGHHQTNPNPIQRPAWLVCLLWSIVVLVGEALFIWCSGTSEEVRLNGQICPISLWTVRITRQILTRAPTNNRCQGSRSRRYFRLVDKQSSQLASYSTRWLAHIAVHECTGRGGFTLVDWVQVRVIIIYILCSSSRTRQYSSEYRTFL